MFGSSLCSFATRLCRRHEATKAIKRSIVWCNPISWFWTFEDSELCQGQWEDPLRSNSLTRVWQTNPCAQTSKSLSSFWERRDRKAHDSFQFYGYIILKWRTILEKGWALLVWSSSGPSDFVKLGVAEELSFFTLPRVAESALAVISAVQECHGYPIPKLLRLLRTLSKGFQWCGVLRGLDGNNRALSSSCCTRQNQMKVKQTPLSWSRCHSSPGTPSFALQAHCFGQAIAHMRNVHLQSLLEKVQGLGGLGWYWSC